jgi:hypothetical protein
MAHKFQLNQRVSIKGFKSNGTITTMPYNEQSKTYIVTFDKPQSFSISEGGRPSIHTDIVVDEKYLKAL